MKRKISLVMITAAVALIFAMGCQHMKARCENCGKTIKVTTLRGVHFDFNKSMIKPEGIPVLKEDIDLMKSDPSLDISVQGHTDSIGSDAYNMQLSEKRAQSVYNYFLGNGISSDRMKVVGFGKSQPIVPNTNASNRALNRRVEIHIIKARP